MQQAPLLIEYSEDNELYHCIVEKQRSVFEDELLLYPEGILRWLRRDLFFEILGKNKGPKHFLNVNNL